MNRGRNSLVRQFDLHKEIGQDCNAERLSEMRSPCIECENADKDKNLCVKSCRKIAVFRKALDAAEGAHPVTFTDPVPITEGVGYSAEKTVRDRWRWTLRGF